MTNNVGMISIKLSRTIGETTTITNPEVFDVITGEVDLGFIVYDDDGTIGVCTEFTRDQNGNPNYKIKTVSLNTEIDIQRMLNLSY